MSVVKHFVSESVKKTEINEFLQNQFERAGYGGVDIAKTPLGTHIVVYAMRPGIVIGRGGETIKELAITLEQKFGLPNPQISVAEIEIPELNAHVIASRVTSALQRGVHFRRAGFWALQQTMEAGALGAEIIIRGKLRTERARYEKFRNGYLPKSGNPAHKFLRETVLHVQLKPGMYGIKVRIMPPDATFPDQVKLLEPNPEEKTEKPEESAAAATEPEKPSEPQLEAKTNAETKKPKLEPETTQPNEAEPATTKQETEETGQ
ncbi:MAG TPA: 30S ribosomal protein S3 [Candidatus Bathyarchaeia archaeon]|nr:30S ribosomal protein S3 [Candidatus Bathyarchaeia archaeon]